MTVTSETMESVILGRPWEVNQPSKEARNLSARLGIPLSIAGFLTEHGIGTEGAARRHLEPALRAMSDPWLMKDMDRAVERLVSAVLKGETIGIFGDYDTDGVTSTALLSLFFRAINQPHAVYIPHREYDGYGLNEEGLRFLHSKGASVVVTVDCGITGNHEVGLARSIGLDVVVTDHHELGNTIPECWAVVDPKRPDCPYPFKGLAGVGVAFNLVVALRAALRDKGLFRRFPEPNLKEFLDIVTIGTIGDLVPLLSENRIFAYTGLRLIPRSRWPGVTALLSECSVKGELGVDEVAFRMVPRINAAGRMDHAAMAFKLLISEKESRAMEIARQLSSFNQERQRVEAQILEEAMGLAEAEKDAQVVVLSRPGWKRGVVGIVASRLVDALKRPVILLSEDEDGTLEGSGRSTMDLDLYGLLRTCSKYLEGFGGHKMAAGLRLKRRDLNAFKEAITGEAERILGNRPRTTALGIQMDMTLSEILQPEVSGHFLRLEPFGPGYEPPLIRVRDFSIRRLEIVGKNHLKFILCPKTTPGLGAIEVIGWGLGQLQGLDWNGLELACQPFFNNWNGKRTLQLTLKDARPTIPGP